MEELEEFSNILNNTLYGVHKGSFEKLLNSHWAFKERFNEALLKYKDKTF